MFLVAVKAGLLLSFARNWFWGLDMLLFYKFVRKLSYAFEFTTFVLEQKIAILDRLLHRALFKSRKPLLFPNCLQT